MALINCSECGREISDKAPACPQCGAPITVAASSNAPRLEAKCDLEAQEPRATSRISDNKIVMNSPLSEAIQVVRDVFGQLGQIDDASCASSDIAVSVRVGYLNLAEKMHAHLRELPDGRTEIEILEPAIQGAHSAINQALTKIANWGHATSLAIESRDLITTAICNHNDPAKIPKAKGLGHTVKRHISASFITLILISGIIITATEEKDQGPRTAANTTPKQEARTQMDTPRATDPLQFEGLTGEWVNDVFAGLLDANQLAKGHRILTLKGRMNNVSSDALREVKCPTEMTVNFSNGRSVQMEHDDVCGTTIMRRAAGIEGMGNGLVVRPGDVHDFGEDNSQQAFLAKVGQALAVSGEYASYQVQSVELKISLVAETVFGDPVRGRIVDASIPPPSERQAFSIPVLR